MNKRNGISGLIIVFITSIIMLSKFETTLADHVAPEVQTQVNKRTDLFEKSIDDLPSLEGVLENTKQDAINGVSSGQGLSFISKQNKNELERESNKLESIHENDLNLRGRAEMIKSNSLNELYVDYSRPLNKQHMKDARAIAEGQNKLLDNLLVKLKELGVDCKTIKGDKKHEPEYFLKIKASQHKDTVYNQTFCEELRNKYYCNDEVTLKCIKRGFAYKDWEHRKIKFSGHALYHEKQHWGYAIQWKKKRWGWHITPHQAGHGIFSFHKTFKPEILVDARWYIAGKIGAVVDQVREDIKFPDGGRGIGDITPVNERWRVVWNEYEFEYYFREKYEVCEVWQEDWTEKCRLQ